MKLIDETGNRYGRLVVKAHAGRDATGKTLWHCACDCGGASVVTALNLRQGNTRACGCQKHRKGADNPRTITDLGRLAERRRSSPAVRAWRRGVLTRDPRCIGCGSRRALHAHHGVGFADVPHLRADPANGAALCGKCHTAFHVRYGRRSGFTEADLAQFVAGIHERPPIISTGTTLEGDAANVVKYVTRWRDKGGLDDLRKAKHYLEKLIEVEGA